MCPIVVGVRVFLVWIISWEWRWNSVEISDIFKWIFSFGWSDQVCGSEKNIQRFTIRLYDSSEWNTIKVYTRYRDFKFWVHIQSYEKTLFVRKSARRLHLWSIGLGYAKIAALVKQFSENKHKFICIKPKTSKLWWKSA